MRQLNFRKRTKALAVWAYRLTMLLFFLVITTLVLYTTEPAKNSALFPLQTWYTQVVNQALGLDSKAQVLSFLGWALGGVVVFMNALALLRRAESQDKIARAQEKTAAATLEANQQAIFESGITNLGDKSESVRLGGAYILYELAIKQGKRIQNIVEVLCAHLRVRTQSSGTPGKKLAEEFATILRLLTGEKSNALRSNAQRNKVKYHLDFAGAVLHGAVLNGGQLQKANLSGAQLQAANLQGAELAEAKLRDAQLQNTELVEAQLMNADLRGAQLNQAFLWGAQLQDANLRGANFQGASLLDADLQRADLQGANLRLAKLMGTDLRDADLRNANFQGASLQDADLRGVRGYNAPPLAE